MKKWISRTMWGGAIGALTALAVKLQGNPGLIAALVAATLGGLARGIQDTEPWNGDDRRAP